MHSERMCWCALLAASLLLFAERVALVKADTPSNASVAAVHTVITTECLLYYEWQVIGLEYRCGQVSGW